MRSSKNKKDPPMPNTYATVFLKDYAQSKAQLSEVDAFAAAHRFDQKFVTASDFPASPSLSMQSQNQFFTTQNRL
jgi:hypothetical protein